MKKFTEVLAEVNQSSLPTEGDCLDFVLNEEYSIQTNIRAIEDNRIYVDVDDHAYRLLEAAGLLKDNNDANA